MLKKFIPKLYVVVLGVIILGWGCTKIDTTTIGSDLIPVVDNVNTFDTILNVNATQGIFNDSTRNNLFDQNTLGAINNDPLFGKTQANIFLQLKPSFYPYYFGGAKDTLNGFGAQLDSVVLCIAYRGFWGDSTSLIKLDVREVNDPAFKDSSYKINYAPTTSGSLLGTKLIDVRRFKDTIFYNGKNGFALNQIRIKLDLNSTFLNNLYPNTLNASDSGIGQQYYSDLNFRTKNKGLAVIASTTGNGGLMTTSLINSDTRLEVHFKRRNFGRIDSVYNSFVMTQFGFDTTLNTLARKRSASANNITRDRVGAPVSSPSADEIFVQTTPGTYADLSVPQVSNLPNCIVHRAELVMEQIPYTTSSVFDTYFSPPNYLYIDLKDTIVVNKWKPLYFDLNPGQGYDPDANFNGFSSFQGFPSAVTSPTSPSLDLNYFGGFRRNKVDQFGNKIVYYNFNVTRHIQRIVTKRTTNYAFRLSAPVELFYPQLFPFPVSYYNSDLGFGRVRLGSGTNPNYKMYFRIIYSKI